MTTTQASPVAKTVATPGKPSRVTIEWVGEHRFDTGRADAPRARIDGSGIAGQSPVDALLSAVAACASVDVVDILAKRRTPVGTLDVEVTGDRVDTIPRRIKHITLAFRITGEGIERAQAERAIDLAITKYCSVRDSLREDIGIDWTLDLNGEKQPAK
jgi:putative redox protein